MTLKRKSAIISSSALVFLVASIIIFQEYRETSSIHDQTVTHLDKINHAGHEFAIEILLDLTDVDSLRANLKDIPRITRQLEEILPDPDKPPELINMEMSFVRLNRVIDNLSPGQPIPPRLLQQVRNEVIKISENVDALKNHSVQQTERMRTRTSIMFHTLFLLLVAYIAGVFLLLRKVIIKPLLDLSSQVELVWDGEQENITLPARTDELGLLAQEFNILIDKRQQAEKDLKEEVSEHKEALDKVKLLSGFLPICASCKQIRDDKGYWNQIESYIRDNSEVEFSHSICPDCAAKHYGDFAKK